LVRAKEYSGREGNGQREGAMQNDECRIEERDKGQGGKEKSN
jgi:hypothetical protein